MLEFLRDRLRHKSRSALQSLLEGGAVSVDGTAVTRFDHPLEPGQCVVVGSAERRRRGRSPIFTVHRLDREVSGRMLYAKSRKVQWIWATASWATPSTAARAAPCARLALHARTLAFIDPVTRQPMRLQTPIPPRVLRLFDRST